MFLISALTAEPLSTHEKRLAALAREIATLEDENVAEKPWLLKGESNAKRRPENSLLETDLEFEHTAKPTPIITEETTKTLEDLIKARILEGRFDDVIRQRPMDAKAFLPSDVIELQDSQSKKSLADLYADDYAAASSSGGKPQSSKLAKEHEELEKSWGEISYKLDALSNAHFTPKMVRRDFLPRIPERLLISPLDSLRRACRRWAMLLLLRWNPLYRRLCPRQHSSHQKKYSLMMPDLRRQRPR